MVAGIRAQLIFWGGVALIAILLIILLREILLPFVLGLIIAYFLDPLADRLEGLGLSRLWATMVIVGFAAGVLLLGLIILLPILIDQFGALLTDLPGYMESLRQTAQSYGRSLFGDDFTLPELGRPETLQELAKRYAGSTTALIESLWSGGMALVSFFSLLLITPVVAFYMLLDWHRLIESIDRALPRAHVGTVRMLARRIDDVISGFLRGQVTVCFILGLFYAVTLSFLGLNYAILIGVGTGILSFIPFVGTAVGFLVSTTVAIAQYWPDFAAIGLVIGVFLLGQVLEGNFLTPKIIGDKVRLHPVWLIFALFAAGYLFGFVGMLLAVPVAAAIGVLMRFALEKYMESPVYQGTPSSETSGKAEAE